MGANLSSLPTFLATIVAFITYTYLRRRNSFLSQLRGPKSHSFWIGNEGDIYYQNEVGDCEFEWVQEFGSAWRRRGCLGEDHLMVADPKALQYILQSSGYNFPKRTDVVKVTEMVAGKGLVCAHGEVHERQRKISAPVFFTSQLKLFIPIFQEASSKLVQKWKDELATLDPSIPSLINVAPWISRATLDIMGQAGFDLHFGTLDGAETELSKIIDSTLYPSPLNLIFKSTWRYIPEFLLRYVRYLPTREYHRFRTYLDCARNFSRDGDGPDMMSVLLQTNASEDPQNRMTHEEVVDQLSALLLAGQETTASTLTWFLWEIARHPESQERIREEIAAVYRRTDASGAELSTADLDGMAYTQAALKESMRLHPIIWTLSRVAGQDDAIPLAFPVTTKSGRPVSSIPVKKGTLIDIAIHAYQRLPEVWGEDAGEWNPDRFLKAENVKQTSIGVYGNLVLEMLVIVTTLVKHFEFSLPSEREGEKTPRVCRKPTVLMMPMAEGHVGPWMGLVVKPLN
ncbi:cytochrome P450 [Lactarius psammicola]|nr:cytochrome P450 [Lactarius psammicola]